MLQSGSQPSRTLPTDETMFHVGHYDPQDDDRKKRRKGAANSREAFDDFDIEEELLDGERERKGGATPSKNDEVQSDEVKMAVHMSGLPIDQAAKAWYLAPFLISNLKGRIRELLSHSVSCHSGCDCCGNARPHSGTPCMRGSSNWIWQDTCLCPGHSQCLAQEKCSPPKSRSSQP